MPMFQLNFDDGAHGFFDSSTTTFYTGAMQKLEIEKFLPVPKDNSNEESYTPEGVKKSLSPDFVRIVLGFKCNFHCKYCSQSLADKDAGTSVDDAVAFAKRFCTTIKSEPRRIEFWGGEPLVYFKHLRAIFPILRERFPETVFAIITNGSLIRRDVLDLLVEFQVHTVISHDGPAQKEIRGEDFLDNPEKRQLWLSFYEASKRFTRRGRNTPFGFTATMTRRNCDINAIVDYLHARFAPDVPVFCDVVTSMGGISSEAGYNETAFTDESLKELRRHGFKNLMRFLNLDGAGGSTGYATAAQSLLSHAMHGATSFGTSTCGADGETKLFVKVDGSVMACQNTYVPAGKYGYIWDIGKVRVTGMTRIAQRESCRHCPFVSICKGACPLMRGNDFADSCKVKRSFYLPAFVYVVNCTYKKRLTSIEGDFRYPVRDLVQTKHGRTEKTSKIVIDCYEETASV